jgi:hypothetical protein
LEWIIDPDVAESEGRAATDVKSNTKIYDEAGKTVFANWSMVDTGETDLITIKYLLPFKLILPEKEENLLEQFKDLMNPIRREVVPYSMLVQKQPGSLGSYFESKLALTDSYKPAWVYPSDLETSDNSWNYSGQLLTDEYLAILLEIK